MPTHPICAIIGMGPGNGAALARRFSREGRALALFSRTTDFFQAAGRAARELLRPARWCRDLDGTGRPPPKTAARIITNLSDEFLQNSDLLDKTQSSHVSFSNAKKSGEE
jgi:NAD(P)-dependent dehydrogenase (short-subunit alcohol dehydrogenase family)